MWSELYQTIESGMKENHRIILPRKNHACRGQEQLSLREIWKTIQIEST